MKNNNFFVLLLIVFFMFCACSEKGGEASKIKIENIDGIPHVYNPGKPLKGEVTIALEKVFEIDSVEIDRVQPPSFSQFTHYGDRIYLFDAPQFKIFIFNTSGKLLKQLPIKGQGPGEIERITQFLLVPHDNDLWIPAGTKIIRYDRDGKFLDEIKFKKLFRSISIIDENSFIGQYLVSNPDEIKQRQLFCVMFNREEKILANYLEGEGLGELPVIGRNPNGQLVKVVFIMPSIVPDIAYGLDTERQFVYLAKTSEYVISVKNLKGKLQRVIHREHTNKLLTEQDRKEIIDLQLYRQPDMIKKLMAENLPASFCAILNLRPLPRGYFVVNRITGPRTYENDIFDPEGRYIYRLKFPGKEEPPVIRFYSEGLIGMVESIDERDVYREYRIKNLTEIFGNTTQ